MRTRKYRGYSNLIGHPPGMVYGTGCFIDESDKHYVISDETGKPDFIQVEEIEDWTDLLDKNGKEVYEGDFIKQENVWQVVWNQKFACVEFRHADGETWYPNQSLDGSKIEIIGNLYENSDLLTQHNSEV